MFYREIEPDKDLRPFILSFWEFVGPSEAGAIEQLEIFPDGCVSIYCFRNPHLGVLQAGITPLMTEPTVRPAFGGDVFWGMRISPAARRGFLEIVVDEQSGPQGHAAELKESIAAQISDSLSTVGSLEAAAISFQDLVIGWIANGLRSDPLVHRAVDIICQTNGETSVSELAQTLDLSARQLQRRMRTASGLSPKQFARIRRVRGAASGLLKASEASWADRAVSAGFADQSHLTHEFTSLAGRTPGSFAKKLTSIKHGRLVD